MSMTTSDANRSFLPDEVGSLIVQPVQRYAVALADENGNDGAATTIYTDEQVHEYRVPVVSADPAAAWTPEGGDITTSDATWEEVATGFYKLAGLTIITRELARDSSPEAAELVGKGLARDIARQVDAAFFGTNITGTDETTDEPIRDTSRPQGLADLQGVNTITAGTAWKDTDPFTAAVYAAESVGATVTSFVAHPDDALKLAQVKKQTGSNEPLLGTHPTLPTVRVIGGVPLLVSPAVTAGTIWGIPRDRALVIVRQSATLDVNESSYFVSDRLAIRATMRVGFLFPHPEAVQKITLTA